MKVEIACDALVPYLPSRFTEPTNQDGNARRLVYAVKDGDKIRGKDPYDLVAGWAKPSWCLGAGRVLIPVPRHSVTARPPVEHGWPAYRLARALEAKGLGVVATAIRRVSTVRQASKSSAAERASVQDHIDSLELLESELPVEGAITLVDDCITQGTQLAACRSLLHRDEDVAAFVVGYTTSGPGEPTRQSLTVTWAEGWARAAVAVTGAW